MHPLTRKLGRDLWRMKGQAFAISAVIATGVMLLVMMSGLVASLNLTKQSYYERHRLADIFAHAKRASASVLKAVRQIDGVASLEGRIVGSALISLPDLALPLRAQAVSLPETGRPALNDIYLSDGRLISSGRADEILLLESFAKAHGLGLGDHLSATMNGSRRTFTIVGLAQSPEFIYVVAQGEMISDDSRFAVIWMNESALAAAYDLGGAFNDLLVSLSRQGNNEYVKAEIDRLLDQYGGTGAYDRADQISNRFVTEELSGLGVSSKVIPPIFLAVAAFLLYIVITRMVQAEREQIGLLKAFGYTSFEIGLHYFKLVLVIALGGAILGSIFGVLAGRGMVGFYLVYYKFPILVFRVAPDSFFIGLVVSVAAASAGGLLALRQILRLTPALAMRPPAPSDYSKAGQFGAVLNRYLDQPSRMILRRFSRQPGRMAGSLIGIACGMALSVAMLSLLNGFNRTIDLTFNVIDHSDVTVAFTHPLASQTVFDLQSIPGVIEVEPTRSVSAILRNGVHSYRSGITGLVDEPRLSLALNKDLSPVSLSETGIILSHSLAAELHIKPGEMLELDIREGRRPKLVLPVAGYAESLLGSPAYMRMESLSRILGESLRISGAYLRIDKSRENEIFETLKAMPSVAGVSLKGDTRIAFERMINQGAGGMRYMMLFMAAVIAFGIVYNAARIAQAERARDIASLRVMGYSRTEAAYVLLGELALILLLALPLGALLGYYLTFAVSKGFSTDLYQIPIVFTAASFGIAALAVLSAGLFSGWLVKRDLDKVDLVSALKIRE